ncbi:MAG: hypothetical protein KF688_19785 [Pirellulales bacterium]|nr:hypothetical protein [Pirellulales bacterium]
MTTIPSTPTCSTCRWWEPDEAETGRCRINPPQPDLLVALEAALRSAERDYSEPPLDGLLRGLCSSTSPLYGCWPTTEPYDFLRAMVPDQ